METRESIATVVAAVLLAAACGGPMTEAQARQTALDYFLKSHPDGVADLQVTESRSTIQGTTLGWEVAVGGLVLEGGAPAYHGALILFIDAASGEVAILAQG